MTKSFLSTLLAVQLQRAVADSRLGVEIHSAIPSLEDIIQDGKRIVDLYIPIPERYVPVTLIKEPDIVAIMQDIGDQFFVNPVHYASLDSTAAVAQVGKDVYSTIKIAAEKYAKEFAERDDDGSMFSAMKQRLRDELNEYALQFDGAMRQKIENYARISAAQFTNVVNRHKTISATSYSGINPLGLLGVVGVGVLGTVLFGQENRGGMDDDEIPSDDDFTEFYDRLRGESVATDEEDARSHAPNIIRQAMRYITDGENATDITQHETELADVLYSFADSAGRSTKVGKVYLEYADNCKTILKELVENGREEDDRFSLETIDDDSDNDTDNGSGESNDAANNATFSIKYINSLHVGIRRIVTHHLTKDELYTEDRINDLIKNDIAYMVAGCYKRDLPKKLRQGFTDVALQELYATEFADILNNVGIEDGITDSISQIASRHSAWMRSNFASNYLSRDNVVDVVPDPAEGTAAFRIFDSQIEDGEDELGEDDPTEADAPNSLGGLVSTSTYQVSAISTTATQPSSKTRVSRARTPSTRRRIGLIAEIAGLVAFGLTVVGFGIYASLNYFNSHYSSASTTETSQNIVQGVPTGNNYNATSTEGSSVSSAATASTYSRENSNTGATTYTVGETTTDDPVQYTVDWQPKEQPTIDGHPDLSAVWFHINSAKQNNSEDGNFFVYTLNNPDNPGKDTELLDDSKYQTRLRYKTEDGTIKILYGKPELVGRTSLPEGSSVIDFGVVENGTKTYVSSVAL